MKRILSILFACLVQVSIAMAAAYNLRVQVTPQGAGTLNRSEGVFEEGSRIYLQTSKKEGFVFKGWYDGDKLLSTGLSYNYTMPAKDVLILAKYEYDPTVPQNPGIMATVTVAAKPSGSGTFNITSTSAEVGSKLNLTATPRTGFQFRHWENEAGEIITTTRNFAYEVPPTNTTLYGVFYYDPSTPGNPDQQDVRSITVLFPEGTNMKDYVRMWLELTNVTSGRKERCAITDTTSYTFSNILPNTTWNVTLCNNRGEIFGAIDNIAVKSNDVRVSFSSLITPDPAVPSFLTLTPSTISADEKSEPRLMFRITRNGDNTMDETITISGATDSRLEIPKSITIPAGSWSVIFYVKVNANKTIDATDTTTLRLSCFGYDDVTATINIKDDTNPRLSITSARDEVKEGESFVFTISSELVQQRDLPVHISCDLPQHFIIPDNVIIPAGSSSVNVTIRTNDDSEPNAELVSTFSVSAEDHHSAQQDIVVIDNDIPSLQLTLSPSTVSEAAGSSCVTATVKRTDVLNNEVTIRLSDETDGAIRYSKKTLTMSPGISEITTTLGPIDNDTIDGDRTVSVFASVYFSSCKCDAGTGSIVGTTSALLTITDDDNQTDRSLPDAQITAITTDKAEARAGDYLYVDLTVENTGTEILPERTPVNLYYEGNDINVATIYTPTLLPVGETTVLKTAIAVPHTLGTRKLYAVINRQHIVTELSYSNNTSPAVAVHIIPTFDINFTLNKTHFRQGETMTIQGKAEGEKGKNTIVEIHLQQEESSQVLYADTDDEGVFRCDYTFPKKQLGNFSVGVCSANDDPVFTKTLTVYGITTSEFSTPLELVVGDAYTGSLILENGNDTPQTGIKIESPDLPGNLTLTINTSSGAKAAPSRIGATSTSTELAAGESMTISYTILPNDISEGDTWQKIPLHITSNEGASWDYTINYHTRSKYGKLECESTQINTTVSGEYREYPLEIRNTGAAATGKITVNTTTFVQTATPREIPSLEPGETAMVILKFVPSDDAQLNVARTGFVGIKCENGEGLSIPYAVARVSEATGELVVDAVDEYTYGTEEKPHVKGATVKVKNPTTGEVITQGTTNENGLYKVTLNEGWYAIEVTAEQHSPFNNNVNVDAGRSSKKRAFLPYNAVTYTFEVEETEIKDEYEIKTVAKYEAGVPKPVIAIELPKDRPQVNRVFPITVTNKGYIKASDIKLQAQITGGYNLQFLEEPVLEELGAEESHVFFVKMVSGRTPAKVKADSIADSSTTSTDLCLTMTSTATYKYQCDNSVHEGEEKAVPATWGQCKKTTPKPGGYGGGGYGGGGYSDDDEEGTEQITEEPVCGDPDDEPCEADCANSYNLEFEFEIVDTDKKSDLVLKGVAADGVSQVLIRLKDGFCIPSRDCSEHTFKTQWVLSDSIGTLKGNGYKAVYTAPDEFPSHEGSIHIVNAVFSFFVDGLEIKHVQVPIEIVRPPVIMIHGLGSSRACWNALNKELRRSGLYVDGFTRTVDYSRTNTERFNVNYPKVESWINDALNNARIKKYYKATKCDIIGHSMGGILARLYAQIKREKAEKSINRIITLNTPHSGSELGDIALEHFSLIAHYNDAIADLAVNSSAINSLNHYSDTNFKYPGIPVCAIATTKDIQTSIHSLITAITGISLLPINTPLSLILDRANHLIDDYLSLGVSDLIVSKESQIGGCSAHTVYSGLNHMESHDDSHIINEIISLLKNNEKGAFSYDWFHPKRREFIHYDEGLVYTFIKNKVIKEFKLDNKNITSSPKSSVAKASRSIRDNRFLQIELNDSVHYSNPLVIISFGDDVQIFEDLSVECPIPNTFEGEAYIYASLKDADGNVYYQEETLQIDETMAKPVSIEAEDMIFGVTSNEVPDLKCIWDDGSETYIIPDEVEIDKPNIARYTDGQVDGLQAGDTRITYKYKGLACSAQLTVYGDDEEEDGKKNSNCSTIKLSFEQSVCMTRQAFRGTLTVNNGNPTGTLKDFRFNVEVKDMDGNPVTQHEFQINAETLNGFNGNLCLGDAWTLTGGGTGVATILFIPTKYAAETEPKDYSFGGSFSYVDPSSGMVMTRQLTPVILTVKPTPNLNLAYFMQRDIMGDDPMTKKIETSEEAEFAVLVNNTGYGEASNIKMITCQPMIADNKTGLKINYEFTGSRLNGEQKTLSLGDNIATDFGNIPARSTSYAQWYMKSSLLGSFKKLDLEATHVTSYGNPDLSLLNDSISIHELERSIDVKRADKNLVGFLVNDCEDAHNTPDMLYLTDGTVEPVFEMRSPTVKRLSSTEFELLLAPSAMGWNYGSIPDPTNGEGELRGIIRISDGAEMSLRNFWQTDRTLRDNSDPLYENKLHFADEFTASEAVRYILTFDPTPEVWLGIDSIQGMPEEDGFTEVYVNTLVVTFNKKVKPESFTSDKIQLFIHGKQQDVNNVSVTTADSIHFKVDFSALDQVTPNGYYVVTVHASGVLDHEGFSGKGEKSVSWILYRSGIMHVTHAVLPEGTGSIANVADEVEYGKTVRFSASPAAGYKFGYWTLNGERVSEEPVLDCVANTNLNVVANFTRLTYRVDILSENGTITGGTTGYYNHGEEISLTAEPNDEFLFSHWLVDGRNIGSENPLTLTVDRTMNVTAAFKRDIYHQDLVLAKGWNWVSTYLNEPIPISDLSVFSERIVGQFDEVIRDPIYGMTGGLDYLESGTGYKVKTSSVFTHSMKGHIGNSSLTVEPGSNWIGYPLSEGEQISAVLSGAEDGDFILAQDGFTEYADGKWVGTLRSLAPGAGYIYKSVTGKNLEFNTPAGTGLVIKSARKISASDADMDLLSHTYPSTMNITARLYMNDSELTAEDYVVYAMSGDELRGIGQKIDGNYYITVYGDDCVDITFDIEKVSTGELFTADTTLPFTPDVIGSRKSPFRLSIASTTDIEAPSVTHNVNRIYSLEGILLGSDAATLHRLPAGIYIINGRKHVVK